MFLKTKTVHPKDLDGNLVYRRWSEIRYKNIPTEVEACETTLLNTRLQMEAIEQNVRFKLYEKYGHCRVTVAQISEFFPLYTDHVKDLKTAIIAYDAAVDREIARNTYPPQQNTEIPQLEVI